MQNPFEFQHITQLNTPRELDDTGSCIVLATPSMLQVWLACDRTGAWLLCMCRRICGLSTGCQSSSVCPNGTVRAITYRGPGQISADMFWAAQGHNSSMVSARLHLQAGLSRELFDAWCEDARNGIIICDFAVQGTLAREILGEPGQVVTRAGRKVGPATLWACDESLACILSRVPPASSSTLQSILPELSHCHKPHQTRVITQEAGHSCTLLAEDPTPASHIAGKQSGI